jgi:hypothetical protein
MNKLTQLKNWFKGKKTYFLALALISYAAGGYFTGNLTSQQALELIYSSSFAVTIRAGIKNSVRGTDQ